MPMRILSIALLNEDGTTVTPASRVWGNPASVSEPALGRELATMACTLLAFMRASTSAGGWGPTRPSQASSL